MKDLKQFIKTTLLEFLNENWIDNRYTKNPNYLYHLTGSDTIENVKLNGLDIEFSKQHKFENGIYLADTIYTASNYSFLDVNRENYYIIEIPFQSLDVKYMKPDDYEMFDLLYEEYLDYDELLNSIGVEDKEEIFNNMKHIYNNLDYRHSLFICGQLLYTKNISPKQFSRILSKNEINKFLKKK